MSRSQFIKPTSPFEDGQFLGDAEMSGSGPNEWFMTLNGEQYTVRRWNWDNALEQGKYIKLGKRCTLWAESDIPKTTNNIIAPTQIDASLVKTTLLGSIPVDPKKYIPIKTGTSVDILWSARGGILPATNTMITGDPGIGKSSVMMSVLEGIKTQNPNSSVLYVSAEMTQTDLMDPESFMKYYPGILDKVEFLFAIDYIENDKINFSTALDIVLKRGYDIVVFDSMIEVQQIIQSEVGLGSGKAAEKFMLSLMQVQNEGGNERKVYTAFLLIQQVKKDGEFVGSRRLEHMITAFLSIKWDHAQHGKKYMEFRKNRRGKVKCRLYFKFTNAGIEYDMNRFEDEAAISDILESGQDILTELTQNELRDILTGAVPTNGDSQDEE